MFGKGTKSRRSFLVELASSTAGVILAAGGISLVTGCPITAKYGGPVEEPDGSVMDDNGVAVDGALPADAGIEGMVAKYGGPPPVDLGVDLGPDGGMVAKYGGPPPVDLGVDLGPDGGMVAKYGGPWGHGGEIWWAAAGRSRCRSWPRWGHGGEIWWAAGSRRLAPPSTSLQSVSQSVSHRRVSHVHKERTFAGPP